MRRAKGTRRASAILEVRREQYHRPEGYEDYEDHVRQVLFDTSSKDTVAGSLCQMADFRLSGDFEQAEHGQRMLRNGYSQPVYYVFCIRTT